MENNLLDWFPDGDYDYEAGYEKYHFRLRATIHLSGFRTLFWQAQVNGKHIGFNYNKRNEAEEACENWLKKRVKGAENGNKN